jgi:hypothetical protein
MPGGSLKRADRGLVEAGLHNPDDDHNIRASLA